MIRFQCFLILCFKLFSRKKLIWFYKGLSHIIAVVVLAITISIKIETRVTFARGSLAISMGHLLQ